MKIIILYVNQTEAVYAVVNREGRPTAPAPRWEDVGTEEEEEGDEEVYVRPPLPYRGYDDGYV